MKECVVVLGMHRSGTSVLSGIISNLGFYLGADEMPVREDNPKGFFENMKVYRLNQSILEEYKTSWDDYFFLIDQIKPNDLHEYIQKAKEIIVEEFSLSKRVFIKDPRLCLLFPIWEIAFSDLGYDIKVVLAYRSPMEVAHSLKVRNGIAIEKSFLMWSHYFFQAEKSSRQYKRLLVEYNTDFLDLDSFISKLSSFLGVILNDHMVGGIKELYTPSLRHHNQLQNNLNEDIPSYLTNLLGLLQSRKVEGFEQYDSLACEFYNSQKLYLYNDKALHSEINKLQEELSTRNSQLEQYKEDLEEKEKELNIEKDRLSHQQKEAQLLEQTLDQTLKQTKDALKKQTDLYEKEKKNRIAQGRVGNELFLATYQSKNWNKKFKRILQENRYFKTKRALLPLANSKNKQFLSDKITIIESGLFSTFYYLTHHPQAWRSKVDPLNFYNKHGWKAGHNPSEFFNTKDYLAMYDDVAQSGVNPLLHYIKIGKKEGRLTKLPKHQDENGQQQTNINKNSVNHYSKGATQGEVTSFKDGVVSGWLLTEVENGIPIVTVNGNPTQRIQQQLTETSASQLGAFKFKLLSSVDGSAVINLSVLSEKGLSEVVSKTINTNSLVPNRNSDLEMALEVSKQKGSVAITVWEGSHNPIGRAKVLYDIVQTRRPVVIFAYSFGEFGDGLWLPLKSLGLKVVLIPYKERHSYQSYIEERNIKFDTVWICKHRLHSFELASYVSHANTACILDIDDNEDVFVSSKGAYDKPYGVFSKNRANYYLNRIKSRSVASISIKDEFGGQIVRHARSPYSGNKEEVKPISETHTAVFIGTIRPHKNIEGLVKAIQNYNQTTDQKVKLAIGGDFNPPTLKQTLKSPSTTILDEISNENLYATLENYDVVITGFPDTKSNNEEINRLQITSKIGDALAVGRPVLTPSSESVRDLHEISGLFIFNEDNFNQKLQEALVFAAEVELPSEFTLEHSYEVFQALESTAAVDSLAGNVFPFKTHSHGIEEEQKQSRNLILVWKQADSGIYGRRIDILARYYKYKYPDSNITVIEIMNSDNINEFEGASTVFDNSSILINDVLSKKVYRYDLDGINYHMITHKDQNGFDSFKNKLESLLTSESIFPFNSVVVLFPLLQELEQLIKVVSSYKVIVDIVDNQVQWMKSPEVRLNGLKQYLELISLADEVVANSPTNLDYFDKLNFFKQSEPHFIPNWYTLPPNINFSRHIVDNEFNLVYSGNLNDRINWNLMGDVCKHLAKHNGYLHIVGSSIRQSDKMKRLLQNENCIYHGVLDEKQLLKLLRRVNFAVVPHTEDRISKYMDPIKLKMYKKLGIKSITTRLPSLPEDDPMIIVADSNKEFLQKLDDLLEIPPQVCEPNQGYIDEFGEKYSSLIDDLLNKI